MEMETEPLIDTDIQKLGIIAGAGNLPLEIVNACKAVDIEVFVVALEGTPKDRLYADVASEYIHIGEVGKITKTLKKRDIKDVILVGKIARPKISALKLDIGGVRLLTKLTQSKLGGDTASFDIVIQFLEDAGFKVRGVGEVAQELLAHEGVLGKHKPDKIAKNDIEIGTKVARAIGSLDVGQAVVIQQGLVLGVEAAEGTDALIKRCASLQKEGKGAILIKLKKDKQDARIDLPTIGPQTIANLKEAGMRGIAVDSDDTLILEKNYTLEQADKEGIFVVGI